MILKIFGKTPTVLKSNVIIAHLDEIMHGFANLWTVTHSVALSSNLNLQALIGSIPLPPWFRRKCNLKGQFFCWHCQQFYPEDSLI